MTARRALWGLIAVSAAPPAGLGRDGRPRPRRGVSLPVRGPPRLELLRPPADARAGRVGRDLALLGHGVAAWRSGSGSWLLFAGLDLAAGAADVPVLRRLGRVLRGVRDERLGLPHGRRRRVRPARRPAALLLAPDARPPRRRPSKTRSGSRPLAGRRPGLGRGAAEQVPRGLPADGAGRLPRHEPSARRILRRPGPYLAASIGLGDVRAGDLAGTRRTAGPRSRSRAAGRSASSGFRPLSLLGGDRGAGGYLLPWVWVPLLVALVARLRRLIRGEATAAERFLSGQAVTPLVAVHRPWPACGRSCRTGRWSGYISAYPLLGRLWSASARPTRARMRRASWRLSPSSRRRSPGCSSPSTSFGVVPDRPPGPQATDRVAQADPTADSIGWDQVGRRDQAAGPARPPGDVPVHGHAGITAATSPSRPRELGVPVALLQPARRAQLRLLEPARGLGRPRRPADRRERAARPSRQCYEPWFERIEPAGEVDRPRRAGRADGPALPLRAAGRAVPVRVRRAARGGGRRDGSPRRGRRGRVRRRCRDAIR